MKKIGIIVLLWSFALHWCVAEPAILLEEKFEHELSKDWFWGLGTWTAKDGVLRGFESGPRRHGPTKLRKFRLADGQVEYEFRLLGKAGFAGIMFNGSQERGHIVHLVITRDHVRILAHPKKGGNIDLLKEKLQTAVGEWHRVKLIFKGLQLTVSVDDKTFTASNALVAEEKHNFGLGGDSGGPEGEKAGALEFRHLKISALK